MHASRLGVHSCVPYKGGFGLLKWTVWVAEEVRLPTLVPCSAVTVAAAWVALAMVTNAWSPGGLLESRARSALRGGWAGRGGVVECDGPPVLRMG